LEAFAAKLGRIGAIGGGAKGGGATVTAASGAERLMRNPAAAGAMGGGGGETVDAAASWVAINILAAAVPSALQAGQFTANGICPFTGSTSNLNF
jgi:hypothetical protein